MMINAKEANIAAINSVDRNHLETEIGNQIKKAVDNGRFTTFIKIDPKESGFLATKRMVENILIENGYKIAADHSYLHSKELIDIQISWF